MVNMPPDPHFAVLYIPSLRHALPIAPPQSRTKTGPVGPKPHAEWPGAVWPLTTALPAGVGLGMEKNRPNTHLAVLHPSIPNAILGRTPPKSRTKTGPVGPKPHAEWSG